MTKGWIAIILFLIGIMLELVGVYVIVDNATFFSLSYRALFAMGFWVTGGLFMLAAAILGIIRFLKYAIKD